MVAMAGSYVAKSLKGQVHIYDGKNDNFKGFCLLDDMLNSAFKKFIYPLPPLLFFMSKLI